MNRFLPFLLALLVADLAMASEPISQQTDIILQKTVEPLTPSNAILLSVTPHFTLWRTIFTKDSTPEQRKMHSWRPIRFPVYHLVNSNQVARSCIATNRILAPPDADARARLTPGGSILFPDHFVLLSPEDRLGNGNASECKSLTFESDSRKLDSYAVEIKPIWKEVVVSINDSAPAKTIYPARYATNTVKPEWEMYVRSPDSQQVAVIPLYDTPTVHTQRLWRLSLSDRFPILGITTHSVTAWDGCNWQPALFQTVTNLPSDERNGRR